MHPHKTARSSDSSDSSNTQQDERRRSTSTTKSRPPFAHHHSFPTIPQLQLTSDDFRQEDISLQPNSLGHPLDIPVAEEKKRSSNESLHESTDTLLDAALDHVEVQDRHARFQDHVKESVALVERMINNREVTEPRLQRLRSNSVIGEAELGSDLESSSVDLPAINTGGSVLSSLMRLEAQRRRKMTEHGQREQLKKTKKKQVSKTQKAASIHEMDRERPKLAHRPTSWLSTMTAKNHFVPSLQRKKDMSPSISRRSSIDSMNTTASQFERITLEERIRITFEIANILQKQELLRKLIKSLMFYGCPPHRLEYIMRRVSNTIGVDAEYVYMPNIMFMSVIDHTTHTTETHFIRQGHTFEMHRLGEIFRLQKLVCHGEVSVDEALVFVDRVANGPPIYPKWLNPFVYALASFTGCLLFFGGNWYDALISAGLAMGFALYELFSTTIVGFQHIWEITVCILIGFVARAVTKYSFCFTPIAFSAFIVILPGYPMAVAIVELVSRQLVAGVIRMVYSIIYAFLLGYGISMGSSIYIAIDPSTKTTTSVCQHANTLSTCDVQRIDRRFFILFVPLFALAFCIFVRARPYRWPTMIIVSAVGYVVNYVLTCYAGAPSQVLQVVPAFTIGLISNLLAKFTGQLSFDAVLIGTFYLVPGGVSIKAGYGIFGDQDNTNSANELGNQGATFALSMIETSIGITIGLFVATLLVYPRGSQHTPLMNF